MKSDTKKKLSEIAIRGGSSNEQEVARKHLSPSNLPAVRSEEADDKWTPMGRMVRDRRELKAYITGAALSHFLKHVKDGAIFTNRTVPLSDEYGSGDFYTILSWLVPLELCSKMGSRYSIAKKSLVKELWNEQMELAKF